MNKDDLKKDFLQPVLKTQQDYDTFLVENTEKPARDETIEESANRYMFIYHDGEKPTSYDDPYIRKIDKMDRLPKVNKLVDQKLQRQQTRINNHTLNQWGMPKSKLAEVPILKRNIKYPKPVKTNPTIERYKNFKEEKKFKEEEKKFNLEFEKEYGHETIKKEIRAKENKNIREGKKPYENFSTNDVLLAELTKDEAKEKLAAIKAEPKPVEPSSIVHPPVFKDTGPKISLEEHMAMTAPKVIDPGGITDLRGARKFRDTMKLANEKFPRKLGGGLAPLLGEED
tara:strand:- start:2195 stop:3046 length:852 start_codon:yes stop_codon:yes gene_type:complete